MKKLGLVATAVMATMAFTGVSSAARPNSMPR
jgi:hypothetical protein